MTPLSRLTRRSSVALSAAIGFASGSGGGWLTELLHPDYSA